MLSEATSLLRPLSFRTSLSTAVALVAVFLAFVMVVAFDGDNRPPGSCTEAIAEIGAANAEIRHEAQTLVSAFVNSYPPGDEAKARRIIAIYDTQSNVMRRAIGVCPASTAEAVSSEIEHIARARNDMVRACSAAHWTC